MASISVNSQRLDGTIQALGRIGETPEGMQRIAFSDADVEGRRYVMELMRGAGLDVRVDAIGNIVGRRQGRQDALPAIGIGSHTDSVPSGGKYDGALGVLAAIEVVRTMNDNTLTTLHPIEVLVFINEEGTTFHRALLGSRAVAGQWESADFEAADAQGVSIGEHLKAIGGDVAKVAEVRRQRGELHAFLELHIEQGPYLYREGIPIAVVTGITGHQVLRVRVQGAANHAGTTPMDARRDALLSASRLALAVNSIATEEELCRVGTVGTMAVGPGAFNVIPGEVEFSVDFRDTERGRLEEAKLRLSRIAEEVARADGTEIEIRGREIDDPCPLSVKVQEAVAEAARRLGLASKSLPSGAGHDAKAMASLTDSGMAFVPSVDGYSHTPREYTTPQDCANGASVVLNAALVLDEG